MRSTYKKLIPILFTTLLAGCGGGGDGTNYGLNGSPNSASSSASSSTTLALGSGVAGGFTSGSMTLGLTTGASLPYGGSTTISVNIVDSTTKILSTSSNTVTFTSNCAAQSKATVTSSVTTTTGVATAIYDASTCDSTDTVTATLSGTTVTATVTVPIAAATTSSTGSGSLELGSGSDATFTSGAMTTSVASGSSLTFGGSATVSVNVVDSSTKALSTSSSTVTFSSGCVTSGQATIDSTVITSTGTATATYNAGTCQTSDTITATLSNGTTATVTIPIAKQVLGSLTFVSASPATIALKGSGTGTYPEVSTLKFKLLDNTGAPIANTKITYALSTDNGGISLSDSSSTTASDGTTSVNLNSGSVNIAVNVTATVSFNSQSISTTSTPIAIVGGVPDQNSFSISATTLNPRGWDYDGTTSTINIYAADRFNNPAPDGTQISFVTDGGSITGTCALSGGTCSVIWRSQDPRPTDGIVNILARTTGEESFIDTNGNGKYDAESFTDTNANGKYDSGEPFTDTNGNGKYDAETVTTNLSEAFNDESGVPGSLVNGNPPDSAYVAGDFFSDFNHDGSFTKKTNTHFQGTGCTDSAKTAGNCANLVEVRKSIMLCMSSDNTKLYVDGVYYDPNVNTPPPSYSVTPGTAGIAPITVKFTDDKGNTPASGTTITVSTDNGKIVAGDTIVIPNTCSNTGYSTKIKIQGDQNSTASGTLKIKITSPDGSSISYPITFND